MDKERIILQLLKTAPADLGINAMEKSLLLHMLALSDARYQYSFFFQELVIKSGYSHVSIKNRLNTLTNFRYIEHLEKSNSATPNLFDCSEIVKRIRELAK